MSASTPDGTAAPSPSQFPLAVFLGMSVEKTGYGTARAEVTIDERHLNPNGVAHGSVVFTLADTSMGAATMSILDEGRIAISALAVGLAQGCLDESLTYANTRTAFGHTIGARFMS